MAQAAPMGRAVRMERRSRSRSTYTTMTTSTSMRTMSAGVVVMPPLLVSSR